MTYLKEDKLWVREHGHGVSRDKDKAHDFSADEAFALSRLYGFITERPLEYGQIVLDKKPEFDAGDDMVWVQHNGCWYAAERQALFLGTRKALERRA